MPENHVKFHSSNGKRLILIVEDEAINREILGIILSEEYEIKFAENGRQALELVREYKDTLSLILLDLIMPDISGQEVLRELKTDPELVRLPVIVMTADKAAEVESLSLGAIDFISKPYPEPKIIQARVRRTIELSEDRDIIRFTERDQLTGLYNREFFYRYAVQFDKHHRDMSMDAIVVDINHFHMINERYGREYGDEVLTRVGEKVREIVSENGGIVCRREADTFLIYCPHRTDYATILENASSGLSGSEDSAGRVRLRMGVYSNVDKSLDIERRFDRAKIASDTVRNSFTKAIAIYDKSIHESEIFAEQLIEDFREAINQKQFQVYYQPKFNIQNDPPTLSSAEALIRWIHPKYGMISPGVFIPLFEKNGLILQLDNYVWRESAARIRQWKDDLGITVPVSVNMSRIDMYDPDLVKTFRGLLDEFDLTPDELFLEITESAYTQDSEQILDMANQLREIGFKVEMDDFGTGYSSLNMISTLPIDALKLDMMFIRNAFYDKKDTRILEVIIEIADYLSVPVIAEGVETEEQMLVLREMGCDLAQGYYFSKPLPPEEFDAFLSRQSKKKSEAGEKNVEITPEIKEEERKSENTLRFLKKLDEKPDMPVAEPPKEGIPERKKTVTLRAASFIFAILAFLTASALYFSDSMVTHGYLRMEQANERYIMAQQAAGNLESGSDYLTDRVRSFVVTGDIQYMNDFFEEINITKSRDRAVTELEELLEGSDTSVYEHLSGALALSNELLGYEYLAMKYVLAAGDYEAVRVPPEIEAIEFSQEDEELSAAEMRSRAEELVFGSEYMDYKSRIRKYTADCTQSLIETSSANVARSSARMDKLLSLQSTLTVALILVVMLFVIFISLWIRRPLSRMVELMRAKQTVPLDGAEEIRFVTQTYNEIFEENQRTNERLTYEAMHDKLTGLLNRSAYEIMPQDVDMDHAALLFIDVDEFKSVNDNYGHDVGDRVLKKVAEILKNSFRSVDLVFRLGGDEFVVIMTRVDSSMKDLVIAKIEQANIMLKNPKDGLPPTSISVGAAFSDRENPQGDIFKDADTALYRMKEGGRCGCVVF